MRTRATVGLSADIQIQHFSNVLLIYNTACASVIFLSLTNFKRKLETKEPNRKIEA